MQGHQENSGKHWNFFLKIPSRHHLGKMVALCVARFGKEGLERIMLFEAWQILQEWKFTPQNNIVPCVTCPSPAYRADII